MEVEVLITALKVDGKLMTLGRLMSSLKLILLM
jgi:hypothetical protein